MKKKVFIALFAFLLVIGIAGTFWSSSVAEAASGIWDSCPKGKINDYYPGDCHDYLDTNNDNICDRSQSQPQTTPTAGSSTIGVTSTPAVTGTGSDVITTTSSEDTASAASINRQSYCFIPIALTCIVLYCISWLLSTRKIIKTPTHRKIWNVVLGISMLGSTLLGLIRILIIDFNLDINTPFNVLFWHVEISIVLGVVGILHIFWHWRYFAKMLGIAGKDTV